MFDIKVLRSQVAHSIEGRIKCVLKVFSEMKGSTLEDIIFTVTDPVGLKKGRIFCIKPKQFLATLSEMENIELTVRRHHS